MTLIMLMEKERACNKMTDWKTKRMIIEVAKTHPKFWDHGPGKGKLSKLWV